MSRRFFGAAIVCLFAAASTASADPVYGIPGSMETQNVLVTGNPSSPIPTPTLNNSNQFNGVVRLVGTAASFSYGCSGALLSTGMHVLTAAHCVAPLLTSQSMQVQFYGAAGGAGADHVTQSVDVAIAPGYTGATTDGRDLAIVFLSHKVTGFDSYDIYRSNDEVGKEATLVGYGGHGNGTTGNIHGFFGPNGGRRVGKNTVDYLWGVDGGTSLAMDFDATGLGIDPAGSCFGAPHAGLGNDEWFIAPGDSGGAMFIDGKIAGVHSWGGTVGPVCGDTWFGPAPGGGLTFLNSSYGEFAGDARVSLYASWIDQQTARELPEPTSMVLLGSGLLGIGAAYRRRRLEQQKQKMQ